MYTIDRSRTSPNRSGRLIDYRYIMLHHTASSNFNNTVNYLCSTTAKASANFVVGKVGEIAEIVPPGIVVWHAGAGSGFGVPVNQMNNYSIGIEMVNLGDGVDPYTPEQLKALDWLIAHVDKTMGKVVPIIDHKAWTTRKVDMRANFPLAAYQQHRKHKAGAAPEPVTPTPATSYIVRITADVLNVRTGPGTSYPIKTTVKKGQAYTIVEEKSGWGRLKSGAGWISLAYTSKNAAKPPKQYLTVKTSGANLMLRATASTSGRILARIPNGTRVELVGRGSLWHRIVYKGTTGYASAAYLK